MRIRNRRALRTTARLEGESHQASLSGRARRYAVRLAVLGAIAYISYRHVVPAIIEENGRLSLELPSAGTLTLGTALFLCINFCAASSWSEIVDPNRSRPATRARLYRVWMLSNIGKYLPGNVLHFAGRYALGRQEGLGRAESVSGLIFEVVSVVSIGSLVGLAGLSGLPITRTLDDLPVLDTRLPVLFIGLAAAAVATSVWISVRSDLLGKLSDVFVHLRKRRAGRAVIRASLLQLACFLLAGAAAVVLLGNDSPYASGYLTLTSAYALAFLAGFILIGAPGGMGVRELTLVTLLSTDAGVAAALGLAVGLRLCSILADVIGAALAVTIRGSASSSSA